MNKVRRYFLSSVLALKTVFLASDAIIELINNSDKYSSKEAFVRCLAIPTRFDRAYKMDPLRPCGRYLYILD